tara:strand:- start:1385 stop:1570 length:186 start_codon:yes stop_codon:yes gene_type:complete
MRSFEMNITSAQYGKFEGKIQGIDTVIDGVKWFVPLDPDNSDYIEIMRQVKEGTLTIQDAD